ncbi:hypothetical protein BGZ65_007059 [Modicella reniformis]|uniref:Uncharacterized protein n=1 Tax=Modicella reniformis TaxID=1440133 RepID=A0A9P6LWT4_9FUNG|nr:hypothetical protein BGZ65_007059 [Modicella reniformis]
MAITKLVQPHTQVILMVMTVLPNLECLELVDLDDQNVPEYLTVLEQGSRLKRLRVSATVNLVPLLPYIPKLRELKVKNMTDDSFGALATYCKKLEVLEWIQNPRFIDEHFGRPNQDGLHQLLVSCSTLKVFDGIERFVNADDIIREPWACRKIEKLCCRIVGIERLTETEQVIYNRIVETNPCYQEDDVEILDD